MRFGRKPPGRYDLGEIIGSGAMGVVYRGVDRTTGQEVALKTLLDNYDQNLLRRFEEECRKLSKLPAHPTLIEIRDVVELEFRGVKKPFLVMSLVNGQSLAAVLAKERLPVLRAVDIILQVLKGLQAAHDGEVIHRDIKPANILILKDNSVKLIDFGLAHSANTQPISSMGAGTPLYCSPEQILRKPLGPASDIFSVGVVLYEMLAGHPPFSGKSESELDDQICRMYPPSIATLNPSVNEVTARVLHKAMAKVVSHRFPTARDFGEMLDRACRNREVEQLDPARIQPRLRRAAEAFEKDELEHAGELIDELADEYLDAGILRLRSQIEQKGRAKRVRQLIDVAKARREEGEYGIALRNIQEALALDEENRSARLLKDEILKSQGEEDIDRWNRIARQHIETSAFEHAREALSHVLEGRPNDQEARRLLSEVGRREAEYLKDQRTKSDLYDSAVKDFQRGKVSTALGKMKKVLELDRQSRDPANPDRASNFEQFYREVASEREALVAAEAQVKKLEAVEEYGEALQICDGILKRFPEQAIFEWLKLRIEERQRQQLSGFIAEVGHQVEVESDLDKKLQILQDARKRFPEETYFIQTAEFVRRRKELADTILAKAGDCEQQGLLAEAISELKSLKEIHPQHPDIDFQLQRLERRRAQQELSQRTANLVEEIERLLESGNLSAARERIGVARNEFPADPEWNRLDALADHTAHQAAEIERLFSEGRALHESGKCQEALPLLQRALSFDPTNLARRRYLVTALVENAKAWVESDWRTADTFIQQALELDPKHPTALSIHQAIVDNRIEEAVGLALRSAREIEEKDPRRAAKLLADAIQRYPNDPRLKQAYGRLARGGDMSMAAAAAHSGAANSVAESHSMPVQDMPDVDVREFNPAPAAPKRRRLLTRASFGFTRRHSDPQVTAVAPGPPPIDESQFNPPVPVVHRTPMYVWLTAATVVLLIALSLLYSKFKTPVVRPQPTPVRASVPLRIRTTPPGAFIWVDGRQVGESDAAPVSLLAGSYRIEARLPGYQPRIEEKVNLALPETALNWVLSPLPVDFVLETNLPSGRLQMDQDPPHDLVGSNNVPNLTDGRHVIKAFDGYRSIDIAITSKQGEPPQIELPLRAKGLAAVAFTSFGGRTTVMSAPGITVQLDSQPPVQPPPEGLALQPLEGQHQLIVRSGTDEWNQQVVFGPETRVSIYAFANLDYGTLLVSTQQEGVTILINGWRSSLTTRPGGDARLTLKSGTHTISIDKPGFQPAGEQKVEIKRGQEAKLAFRMTPLVTTGTLRLKSTPGADVYVNGAPAGTVPQDGTLEIQGLNPSSVTIRVEKRPYRTVQRAIQISVGPNAQELQLTERLPAKVVVTGVPPGATVQYHRRGEQAQTTFQGTTHEIPEGEYVFTASAPGRRIRTEPVALEAGATRNLDLTLEGESPVSSAKPASTVVMPFWSAKDWQRDDDGWFSGAGSGASFYGQSPLNGRLMYSIESPNEAKAMGLFPRPGHIDSYLSYVDSHNYILIRLEPQKAACEQVIDNKKSKCGTMALPKADRRDVRIDISPESIVVSIDGQSLSPITTGGRDFTTGKFGFILEAKRKIRISAFRFLPKS